MESFASFKRRVNVGTIVNVTNYGTTGTPERRTIVKLQSNGFWTARPLSLYQTSVQQVYRSSCKDPIIVLEGVEHVKVFFKYPKASTVRVYGKTLDCLSYKLTLSHGEVVNAPFNNIPAGNVWLRIELLN